MKINKRGSQSSNTNTSNSIFHSRKNSMKDPISLNSMALAQTANLNTLLNHEKLMAQ